MTTMNEVRKLLKNKGIKQPARATKVELVRLLQRSEDNFDWREDCFKAAKA
jgi:hypothetical protein